MLKALRSAAAKSWQLNRLILLLGAGYIVLVELVSRIYGFPHFLDLYHKPLVLASLVAVVITPLWLVAVERPEHPFAFMVDLFRTRWNLVERAFSIGPPVIVLGLMMSSFSSIKSSIHLINPYLLDPLFLKWDRALHGGQDPWVLLHPILASPGITRVIDSLYGYWLGIMIGVLTYAIFMTDHTRLRNQFVVAWILSWALAGTIGAIALNSVGPCFYGLFFPEAADPFAPLVSYLSDTAPISVFSQKYLWQFHQELGPGFGTGISAMPSMHVAIAALQAVFLWRLSRIAGVLAGLYAAIVLIGSVHLGWHYAIDGYVAIALVPVMWWAGGWMVGRSDISPLGAEERDFLRVGPSHGT